MTGTVVAPLLLGMNWMSPEWRLQAVRPDVVLGQPLGDLHRVRASFPFLPGDTRLFAIRRFLATHDLIVTGNPGVDLLVAVGVLSGAACLGNVTGYEIGRRVGAGLTGSESRFLAARSLAKTREFFGQHGDRY